jgi:predicted N-acetyltransferase YhbS
MVSGQSGRCMLAARRERGTVRNGDGDSTLAVSTTIGRGLAASLNRLAAKTSPAISNQPGCQGARIRFAPLPDPCPMTTISFAITTAAPGYDAEVEALLDQCFGLGRRTKTTYRLREGERPVSELCHVAHDASGRLIGAISFWDLRIGEAGTPALLLGPLAVAPDLQGMGVGRALMHRGIAGARGLGHRLVILVGDQPYYGRVGFRQVPSGQLLLPGPVDPARLLYLELEPGALQAAQGLVTGPRRFSGLRDTRWRPAVPAEGRG